MSRHVETLAKQVSTVASDVQGLIAATRTAKGIQGILHNPQQRDKLVGNMVTFVAVDVGFESGMRAMGEILTNLINQPDEVQTTVIHAICAYQGVPVINEVGRKGFAAALFANVPSMKQKVASGKDTKGALRLSSYMFAYRHAKRLADIKAGRVQVAAARGEGAQPRSARELFVKLYLTAKAAELGTILAVAQRAGILYQKWITAEVETKKKPKARSRKKPQKALHAHQLMGQGIIPQ